MTLAHRKLYLGALVALLLGLVLFPAAASGVPAGARPAEGMAAPAGSTAPVAAGVELGAYPPVTSAGVRLLSSTAEGVTYTIEVPWQHVGIDVVGGQYAQVSLPGWTTTSQAGAPALPMLVQTIGAPFGAEVVVRVEPGQAHTQALPSPAAPAATNKSVPSLPREGVGQEPMAPGDLPRPVPVLEEDSSIYDAVTPYPGMLAKITADGVVRQQRVIGVAAFPVQYRPAAGEITVYESLTVHVTFGPSLPDAGRAPSAEPASYEEILRAGLLNYDTARSWRQTLPPTSLPERKGESLPWSPPVPGWRVKVRADGFYKLTYGDLQAAGLPVETLDPRTFQVFYLGTEAAIDVTGQADGVFDPGDYVIFYGQAVESKYTRDNVYWLTFGEAAGMRLGTRDGAPGSASTPDHFAASLRAEQQTYYIPGLPGDEGLERWLWDYVYPPSRPSRSISFVLDSLYTGQAPATLTVALWGGLDNAIEPDHHARFYLNGTLVGDAWWDGLTWKIVEMAVSQELLVEGSNTIVVECPNDTGVGIDVVYIDRAELEYADAFTASGNELAFGYEAPGTWLYEMDGFTGNEITAYDVTDAHAVVRIEGIEVNPSGGGYTARMEDDVSGVSRYWALAVDAYRSVQAIEPDTPSDLRSALNGADHLVVTHAAFWDEAGVLSGFRSAQGLRAMRVDVQDVYDEFGYGVEGNTAIHGFLAYAYAEWQAPAPSVVVLIGDGHYDPKDYYGFGLTSYLPPYLAPVDPWTGETAADNRYVTLVGDDAFPDMMLGRLAVNSHAQASALVSKIVAYEASPEPGSWNQHVLAVADNGDGGGNFSAESDELLSGYLPEPYEPEKVYYLVTHQTVAAARQAIQDGINSGQIIVNYVGHGSANSWASEGLLTTADVPLLQNAGRLPVMLPMTCYEGYYHYPFPADYDYDALAEVITRAGGRGAVASWSPTGAGIVTGHSMLNTGFFEAALQDGLRSLGQATTAGKLKLWATGVYLDLLDTYLLFGDPATRMNTLGADLAVTKSVSPAGTVLPGSVIEYTLAFANNGPATAHGVVLSDPLPALLTNPKVVYQSPEVVGLIPGTSFAWEIADLPAGASGSVRWKARVLTSAPPGDLVNTAEIAGAEADSDTANNSAAVTSQVAAAMRVASIVLTPAQPVPGKYAITAKVRIVDAVRAPVGGAAVSVEWSWPDGSTTTQQALTNSTGTAQFRIKATQLGTYRLCVTDVVKVGWYYNGAANAETCDSVTIP